jgi:NADH-quinone oxidoreductase subunit M
MNMINEHILSIITFLPLFAAIATAAMPSLTLARWTSMAGAILTFLGTLHVWYWFDGTSAGLQFTEAYDWIPAFGIRYLMGVDGISLLLVVLTGFLCPLILLSVWPNGEGEGPEAERKQKGFLSLFMGLECGMLGALVSFDLVFFYVFWEAMLIPMYFIIGIWGGANRIYATTKFIIYTFAGSLLMLVAGIALYVLHYQQTGNYSTSLLDLYRTAPLASTQMWLFAAFALAFAIKVPLFPFHTWLPDAHTEAPTAGSVILAGVLLKMGTYGLLRFAIPLFPTAVAEFAPLIMALGVIGIVYGALNAWMQKDAKKMVAFSSVSHLGFVVIGSFALVAAGEKLSAEALTGAVYQAINHGISTGALFFLIGVIYERRHTRLLADYGGLAKAMPWFAVILIVATLSSVGLPGTGGFAGEFFILLGTFRSSPFTAICAVLGVLLGPIYMLTLCRGILFGPLDNPENQKLEDLSAREFVYLVPLAVLAIVMGVFPNLFLDKIRPSIENLADNFKSYRLVAVSGDLVDETAHTAAVDPHHDQQQAEPATTGRVGH